MLHSPQTALYWGSYLMKVCAEVKALCMQFESVVTNGTLSFRDVVFLEIAPKFAPLFKLSESGGIDWKTFFDDLGNIGHNFTKENLQADIDNLYNLGVGLATAGADNFVDTILGKSSFHDLLNGKISDIARVAGNAYNLYGQLEHSVGNTLLSMVGGPEGVANLFQIDNYNLTSWISDYLKEDYLKEAAGQYPCATTRLPRTTTALSTVGNGRASTLPMPDSIPTPHRPNRYSATRSGMPDGRGRKYNR